MSMKHIYSCVLALLILPFSLLSQPICGFDHAQSKLSSVDPLFAKAMKDNEQRIQQFIKNKGAEKLKPMGTSAALFVIPVVVHVMHTGGSVPSIYNPSDATIINTINYLNSVYDGTYPGTVGAGDIQIKFELATKDPNCNATTGIERIDMSGVANYVSNGVNVSNTTGIDDTTMKNYARWDANQYYNIWVVNKIDGRDGTSGQFVAGYAFFAGVDQRVDGTVMLATQMYVGSKTLPHEIGHALSLYHTFQGSNNSSSCPTNGDCTQEGDRVCDTDPVSNNNVGGIYDFSCRTGANSCNGGINFSANTESNYMAYTNCYDRFTPGQKTRMLAAMTLPQRASLANSYARSGVTYPVASFSAPSAASCTPNTGTGLTNYFAGILGVSVSNKIFSSYTANIDKGYLNRANQCNYLIPLVRNNTYNFSLTIWGNFDEQLRVWIDYNNDGIFDNTTEQILYTANIPSDPTGFPVISGSFTVPGTAVTGSTLRLRVIDEISPVTYGPGFTITSGCYNPQYGQAEDYPVFIFASLPVKMDYFTGTRKNNAVTLNWKTSYEQNALEFQVERSLNGKDFSKIGTVPAANITNGKTYSFIDPNAGNGKVYYRLNQVDNDQKNEYSKIIVLNAGEMSLPIVKVMSNPFGDQLSLQFNQPSSAGTEVSLFDMAGRKVYAKVLGTGSGQVVNLDLSNRNITAGVYMLRVQIGKEVYTEKVIRK